jgi:hypothetical protein
VLIASGNPRTALIVAGLSLLSFGAGLLFTSPALLWLYSTGRSSRRNLLKLGAAAGALFGILGVYLFAAERPRPPASVDEVGMLLFIGVLGAIAGAWAGGCWCIALHRRPGGTATWPTPA